MLPDDHHALLAGWSRVDQALRAEVTEATYHLYLADLAPRRLADGRLEIAAPLAVRAWVERRFRTLLRACAVRALGIEVEIALVDDLGGPEPPPAPAAPTRRRDAPLNPKYCFEQFVIGDANRLAHAAALAVAEQPGQAYNPLFLYGPPGVGKTHLLHAVGNYLQAYGDGLVVRTTTAEAFTAEFVDALRERRVEPFKARYRGTDVLLIDDVQFLERKARTEEEFFHTFNALHQAGSQLVLTSDRRPRDLEDLEDRLRERFEAGLLCDVAPPDRALRLAILRTRVRRDGIELDDLGALEVIADRAELTVRALEGALIRVVAHSSLTRRALDAELAHEVLERLHPRVGAALGPSVADIQRATAEAFDLTLEELLSDARAGRIAWPRQVAMHLARELTDESLPALGRLFGGRNHSTVLHACRRTQARLAEDAEARADVDALLRQLRGGDDLAR